MALAAQRILIIGGGFSGMSAAIELRKLGAEVDLVEIDPGWRSYGAGISLGGATLRAFRQLGILDTQKAIALAMQFNLDLVEVAATATPPVCRIMDFGKYVYEEQKKHAHSKPAGAKLKEIEFTVRIEKGDFNTKVRHAEEFLDHGNKVKLRLKFRGREMAHTELGLAMAQKIEADVKDEVTIEQWPRLEGRQMHMMIAPKKK